MPFKDFVTGAKLTAAEVDSYLMRQTVMTFATAAARDAALSGVLAEGMVAYLEDTDSFTYYSGTAWLNVWRGQTSYDPAAGWAVNGTNVTGIGTWTMQGDMIDVIIKVTLTGTPTNGTFSATLPFEVHADQLAGGDATIGQASIHDFGTGWRTGWVVRNTGTFAGAGAIGIDTGAVIPRTWLTHTVPFTFGTDDGLILTCRYRKAA